MTDLVAKWDDVFRTTAWGKYPAEELIRFVARHYYNAPVRQAIQFLDLGCGKGTSCWYLAKEGFSAYGIDGSASGIEFAQQWLCHENLSAEFKVSLMQEIPYDSSFFDCVIDNVSIGSTAIQTIGQILGEVLRVLKPGGRYFGIYLGKASTISGSTDPEDPFFYTEITSGPIQRAATTRLVNAEDLKPLLSQFDHITLDRGLRTVDNQREQVEYWYVSAQKPLRP